MSRASHGAHQLIDGLRHIPRLNPFQNRCHGFLLATTEAMMAVGLARVTGGISSSCDRDEGKAVLAGYVACPRVRTHDATVVPVMHEECRYLDLAEVEARQVYLEAAWLEGNPPNARSSAGAEV